MYHCENKETGLTGAMILELCRTHALVRHAIPEGFELVLPRFRLETHAAGSGEIQRWVAECWWRSAPEGTLGYYVKIDLLEKCVWDFRELSGEIAVPGMDFRAAEMAYLDHFGISWTVGPKSEEAAEILDEFWQALAPAALREYAMGETVQRTITSYLLPPELLTCWNWEKLRDMLLKRENTTVENIRDYIAYKNSGSDKLYIEPEHRAEAKKRGMKFWRDEDDVS